MIVAFGKSQKELYADLEADCIKQGRKDGVHTFTPIKISKGLQEELAAKVSVIEKKYHTLVSEFFAALKAYQQPGAMKELSSIPGIDSTGPKPSQVLINNLGFLAFRLDFNEFYSRTHDKAGVGV